METNDTVVERLELELGYDEFLGGLRTITNAYHSALDKINNMGANVGKALTQSSKLVQDTVNQLSAATANSVKNSFATVEQGLNKTHDNVRKISSQISKDIKEIEKITQKKTEIGREKDIKLAENIMAGGTRHQQEYEANRIVTETNKKLDALDVKIASITSKMYQSMSHLGLESSKAFSESTNAAAKGITKMAIESSKTLNNLFKVSGTVSEGIGQITSDKQTIDRIKAQRETLSKQLIAIEQQRISAKAAVDLAEIAMNKQANTAMQKDTFDAHQKATLELNKVIENQKRAVNLHKELGDSLSAAYGRLPEAMNTVKVKTDQVMGSLKEKTKAAEVAFKSLFEQVNKSMSISGKLESGDLGKYFNSFIVFRTEINEDVAALNKFINELKKLKSTDPGIKNHIDEITALKERYEALQKSINDAVRTTEKLNFSGSLAQSKETLAGFGAQASRIFDDIRKQKVLFKSEDFSSSLGIQQGLGYWKQLKSSSEEMRTVLKRIRQEIADQEKALSHYEVEITKTDNEEKKKSYRTYADGVKSYLVDLRAKLEVYQKEFTTGRGLRESLTANAETFKKSVLEQMSGWKNTLGTLDSMKAKYEEVRSYASKYGASNREAAQQGKVALHAQAEEFINVKQRIQETIKSLHQLTKSKDLGFNATDTINELSRMLRQMNTSMTQVRGMMAGSTKFVDQQARQASKAWYTLGWEYIRNFRWQVATALYLTQAFVRGVENYFFNALKKVDEFRKGVYALTATTGLSFGKEFGARYNEIYAYSTDLAEKLQHKAGESYASLEDLMLVTRSFAQSGVFPRSTEDIERVNTLATAVKVMTEGMANSGVQMRQEIMALIEGRQRVTDSVALAFRMQGIDIKKEMESWAKEGKSKLQGFAELLEPFARVNKEINKELGTQINHLKTVWDYVQRMALTKITLNVASDLNEFALSLRDKSGALTELGQSWVKGLATGFQIFWQLLKSTWEIVKQIGSQLWTIFETLGALVSPFSEIDKTMSSWGQTMYTVLRYIMALEFAIVTLMSPIRMIAEWFKAIAYDVSAIIKLTKGDLKGAWEDLGKSGQAWIDSLSDYPEYLKGYEKRLGDLQKNVKELDKSVQNVGKTQAQNTDQLFRTVEAQILLNKTAGEFEQIYEKNRSKEQKAAETKADMKDKYDVAMKAAQEAIDQSNRYIINATNWGVSEAQKVGIEAINQSMVAGNAVSNVAYQTTQNIIKEHGLAAVTFTAIQGDSASNIAAMSATLGTTVKEDCKNAITEWQNFLNSMAISWAGIKGFIAGALSSGMSAGEEAVKAMDAKKAEIDKSNAEREKAQKALTGGLVGPTKIAQDVLNAKSETNKLLEMRKGFTEIYNKATKAVTDKAAGGGSKKTLTDMYDEYMSLLDRFGSVDPFEKLTYDYWKHLSEIDRAAQENTVVMEHYDELRATAAKYYMDQVAQKQKEIEKNIVDFQRKITGLDASPLQRIEETFKDLVSEIDANKNLDQPTKDWLKAMIPANRELAKTVQLQKESIELEQKRIEVVEAQAKYLDLSVSTTDKQTSAAMRLNIEYRKWILTQEESLRNAEKLAKSDPERYTAAYEEQRKIFEQSNVWMKASLDEQLNEVWNPFYKDLKDMQQGWADSISSTMTDILFDAKDWKTKVTDLMKDISKQIINAFIKRNIVEPMMNQTSDIMKGGIFGKLFGTSEGKTGTESSGPMSWLNKGLNFLGLGTKSEESTKGILSGYSVMNPLPVMVTNMGVGTGFGGGGTGEGGLFGGASDFLSAGKGFFTNMFSNEGKSQDVISKTVSSLGGLSNSAVMTSSTFGQINSSGDSLSSSFMSNASSLTSSISSMISSLSSGFGGQGGGGLGSLFSGLFGGGSSTAMAEGGTIKEPIFGVGLKSGASYTLGEKEDELVTPMSKVKPRGQQDVNQPIQQNTFVNFHMNAIDSKTGAEFLVKHSDVLEGVVSRAVKNNRGVRRDVLNSR